MQRNLPNYVTLLNLFCGFLGIVCCLGNRYCKYIAVRLQKDGIAHYASTLSSLNVFINAVVKLPALKSSLSMMASWSGIVV